MAVEPGRYRYNGIEVSAVRWWKAGDHPLVYFNLDQGGDGANEHLIDTQEHGARIVRSGDWIVTGMNGSYPCRDEIFRSAFEEVRQ